MVEVLRERDWCACSRTGVEEGPPQPASPRDRIHECEQVRSADDVVDAGWCDPRMVYPQRHPEMGVEDGGVVKVEPVLAERLAVIRGHDEHRVVEQAGGGRRGVEPVELAV